MSSKELVDNSDSETVVMIDTRPFSTTFGLELPCTITLFPLPRRAVRSESNGKDVS